MEIINDTDQTIVHTLVDGNGDAIDTSLFTGIVAKVFQKGTEIDKFSMNTQSGFGDIIKATPAASGGIEFYLNASRLRSGISGFELFYEIKTQIANTDFENNTETSSTGAISLGILEKTKLVNETFS